MIRSHVWRKNVNQKDISKRDYFMCSKITILVGSIDSVFGVWGGVREEGGRIYIYDHLSGKSVFTSTMIKF